MSASRWCEIRLGQAGKVLAMNEIWELAEHRSLFIEEDAERAGGAIHTIFVEDLDARVAT